MDYGISEIKPDRTGSLEEMLRFQAKHFEEKLTMSEEANLECQSLVKRDLNRLANAMIYKKSNKDFESSLNDKL